MDLASTVLTNLISGAALAVSALVFAFYIFDRKNAKFSIENDYCNQLLSWHAKVVHTLLSLSANPEDFTTKERQTLSIELSSLIEQGRFYFPNITSTNYGKDKPPAYRGYRNLALDFLVASYKLHQYPHTLQYKDKTVYIQKLFTSIVFEIVRPVDRLSKIQNITKRYFIKDLSFEDLQDKGQIDAVRHMWREDFKDTTRKN